MCELLELILKEEGHHVATAADGAAALRWIAKATFPPDLIIADYNLPGGMDGIAVMITLREKAQRHIPVIVLTADISIATLRSISGYDCVQLSMPVKSAELRQVVDGLLPELP